MTKVESYLYLAAIFACLSLGTAASDAASSTAVGVEQHLAPAELKDIKLRVETDRHARPQAFAEIAALRHSLPQLQLKHQGRFPPISRYLKRMGSRATSALVAEMVTPTRDSTLDDHLWLAWRMGVTEALGELQDSQSEAVLLASLKSATEPELGSVAAASYAKLGTQRVAATLITLSQPGHRERKATLAGMGHCRRAAVAQALEAALNSGVDDDTAVVVIRSLGQVGALWVWRSGLVPEISDSSTVRTTAARALVHAFVQRSAPVQAAAERALLIVAEPSSLDYITDARKNARPALAEQLDRLAQSIVTNRIR